MAVGPAPGKTKTSPRPGHAQPADARQKKRQLNKGKQAASGTTRGRQHTTRRRCPPQVVRDVCRGRTKRCRNPVIKTVVAAGLGRGAYAGSANESKPDGGRPPRCRSRAGGDPEGNAQNQGCSGENRNPEGSSAGESVRSRFGRTVSLSGRRLSASPGGRGYSASEKNN